MGEPILISVGRKRWKKESHNLQGLFAHYHKTSTRKKDSDVSNKNKIKKKVFFCFPQYNRPFCFLQATRNVCTYRICNQRRLR